MPHPTAKKLYAPIKGLGKKKPGGGTYTAGDIAKASREAAGKHTKVSKTSSTSRSPRSYRRAAKK